MPESAPDTSKPLTLWQIVDGKPGHENQSRGLIDALSRLTPIERTVFSIQSHPISWAQALRGQLPNTEDWPQPDLIIGAGSRTHPALFAAGRQTGAKTVVLMSPPVYLRPFFDLCIVPEHDQVSGPNVLTTKGALNSIRPSQEQSPERGLFLIGGPSKHHDWDPAQLIPQIEHLLKAQLGVHWKLTTSRRTPEGTLSALQSLKHPQLVVIPASETTPEWVPDALTKAAKVWVTEDSVSMLFEALSSGASVGRLQVPRKPGKSRVLNGIDQLINEGYLTPSTDATPANTKPPLAEADRIAKLLLTQLT